MSFKNLISLQTTLVNQQKQPKSNLITLLDSNLMFSLISNSG